MQQVPVDVQQAPGVTKILDDVRVPDLVERRSGRAAHGVCGYRVRIASHSAEPRLRKRSFMPAASPGTGGLAHPQACTCAAGSVMAGTAAQNARLGKMTIRHLPGLFAIHQRCASAGHLAQQAGAAHPPRDDRQFLQRLRSLDESDVGTGLQGEARSHDSFVQAVIQPRVCAGDQHESGSRRASTAARILAMNSSRETTSLPSRWPQRLGATWPSMWIAATPRDSYSEMVRVTFSSLP